MSPENELHHVQVQVQVQEQLVELQTQLAFQEDTITSLNEALANQQQDLNWLKRQWELLKQQYGELQEQLPGGDVADEKPPHY